MVKNRSLPFWIVATSHILKCIFSLIQWNNNDTMDYLYTHTIKNTSRYSFSVHHVTDYFEWIRLVNIEATREKPFWHASIIKAFFVTTLHRTVHAWIWSTTWKLGINVFVPWACQIRLAINKVKTF